ncbi:MAG: hypothetical protein CBD62_01180 [Candidatus Pelagibacter sp. TMED202]|nr:MAG: hypothetical protein CBD62_01180 [Candidatus Pelagibacter sp. TMED202]|tara:strand:+ start:936 stop:1136 length:201 start_codon:yes stop_codon:yes gene_type:complete
MKKLKRYMYTVQVTEDYLFDAEDINTAMQIAGLIQAVNDPELAQEIVENNNGFVQVDVVETIEEEE